MDALTLNPIGVFRGSRVHPYEAGRQPDDRDGDVGEIVLNEGANFEQALQGLDGAERIWVVFWFHRNSNWKPMVRPPRGRNEKIGVFATRAPYRPNPIGLSCLRLVEIKGRRLRIAGADLLDGTPILDIKPYVAEADAFPTAKLAWLERVEGDKWIVDETPTAKSQLDWLYENGVTQLRGFVHRQLEFDPFDSDKKRVEEIETGWVLAYRTWRIFFAPGSGRICIQRIASAYTSAELDDVADPYADKETHRRFRAL